MKSKRRPILPCDLRDVNPQSLFRAKKEKRADASMISLSLGVRMKDKRAGKKIEGSLATSFNLILRQCRETVTLVISF
jgi:hypothetical protein